MISRKLDGVRTICVNENNSINFYSRTGSQFQTLEKLIPDAIKLLTALKDKTNEEYVLDGECCLFNDKGEDDFSGIMKEITRKKHTIESPHYVIFDAIKKTEFDLTHGTTKFKDRMSLLENVFKDNNLQYISLIDHANSIDKQTYFK
jgi:ATP-dependent DNA ligase